MKKDDGGKKRFCSREKLKEERLDGSEGGPLLKRFAGVLL
jgi:hypothetical protein